MTAYDPKQTFNFILFLSYDTVKPICKKPLYWGGKMNLIEAKLDYENAERFILPLLEKCVGLASVWPKEFEDGVVTALVPEDISGQHLLDFDQGGFPAGASGSFQWLENHLRERYTNSEKSYVAIFQDIWAKEDYLHSEFEFLEVITSSNGVYYIGTIDELLLENIDKAVWSGSSFFTLAFVTERTECLAQKLKEQSFNQTLLNSCSLVLFGAYDQESFLLFRK